MRISARNILKGKVTSVVDGAVTGTVAIDVDGLPITANITMEAIKDLGIDEGVEAYAIVKASSVEFARPGDTETAAPAYNKLPGTVSSVRAGAARGCVTLELADGATVAGTVANDEIASLGLQVGAPAVALVEPVDVIVGVD